MPRQRENKQKKENLSPLQMRDLIEEYDIEFRGPLSRSQWPPRYVHIFEVIRDIGLMEFDEYKPEKNGATNWKFVDEIKRRAIEVVEMARKDRSERVNEDTLRDTEPLVLYRFRAKAKWYVQPQ